MDINRDPYDRQAVLDKLAEHAWTHTHPNGDLKHQQEFIARGIDSQAKLRQAIAEGIERKDTIAFSTRPDPQKSQVHSREFYEISLKDKNNEPYKLLVIVNPGLDKKGQLSGGTCYIPNNPKQMQEELLIERTRSHNVAAQWEPQLVIGGRPALREQASHQSAIERPLINSAALDQEHGRNAGSETAKQQTSVMSSVDELAASYAKANPESGASAERYREAAYFAHAVEDSDKYPPRDDEMRERVEQRQFEEQFEKNYLKGSGEPPREDNKQEIMQERMQSYMDRQNQYTM